jgi:hypothetical protein
MNVFGKSPEGGPPLLPEGTQAGLSQLISIETSKAERRILVKLTGRPRPESIVRMLEDVNTLIEQDPALSVLIDENDLRPSFVGPGDIGRFVDAWRRSAALRKSRIAVFVSSPAMYGLNRMFQSLIGRDGEGRMMVFGERRGAEAWLKADG